MGAISYSIRSVAEQNNMCCMMLYAKRTLYSFGRLGLVMVIIYYVCNILIVYMVFLYFTLEAKGLVPHLVHIDLGK